MRTECLSDYQYERNKINIKLLLKLNVRKRRKKYMDSVQEQFLSKAQQILRELRKVLKVQILL